MKVSFIRRLTGLVLLLVSVGLFSCQAMFVSLTPPLRSHAPVPTESR